MSLTSWRDGCLTEPRALGGASRDAGLRTAPP